MDNPTVVVITDRNDLDDQLFDTFAASRQLLRQEPVQAEDRNHLKELLKVGSGGVVFTTIQKFSPEEGKFVHELLSGRENIIVVADEAHRSHYGFKAKNVDDRKGGIRTTYGFAKYLRDALPKASFIGFTATPIEKEDASTPAVFGNYIDVYDIERSIEDGATVKIFYESRLAKIHLKPDEKEKLDEEVEEITEGRESTAF
jgi:type I restriction enzyme R subunit